MKTHLNSSRSARRGFTLVEVLVVIAIIVVLAALSIVAIDRVRGKAQVANAIHSLRQVGIAQGAYASENHGSINVLLYTGHPLRPPGVRNHFWGHMQPYLFAGATSDKADEYTSQLISGISSLFNTPDARTMSGTPFAGAPIYGSGPWGVPTPIGFNNNLIPPINARWVRMATIDNPARTIYCAYGRFYFDPSHGKEYRPLTTPNTRGFFFLENRKAIVCFLDGHIETINPPISEHLFGNPPPAP